MSPDLPLTLEKLAPSLYFAASTGLPEIVNAMSEQKLDVYSRGGELGTALQVAPNHGHEDIVRILLEKGAHVNAQGGCWGNALQAVSSYGHNQRRKQADIHAA